MLPIAPPQRFGSFAHVAILEPRWWPCQIQVLSQKLTGGGLGGVLPNLRSFGPKIAIFRLKEPPKPGQNAQMKGISGYTPSALSLPRVNEPSGALHLHDMSEKLPKKAPKSPKICPMCTNNPKPSTGRILGYVAQNPRAPSPPATPHFLWFPSLRIANETPRSPYQRSFGGAGGQPGPRTVGANGGSTTVPGVKRKIFSKLFPDPLGCLDKWF